MYLTVFVLGCIVGVLLTTISMLTFMTINMVILVLWGAYGLAGLYPPLTKEQGKCK